MTHSILSSRRCNRSMRSTPWGMVEIGQPRRHSLLRAKDVAGPKNEKAQRDGWALLRKELEDHGVQ